jgi:hypothetical protein
MKRSQIIALAALLAVAALVAVLALRNPQPPLLPADEEHAGTRNENCLECHGPEGMYPRSRNHPLGSDCARCHGRR